MRNLAVIPARSGSKGLVDKNIKLLNGKPLLAYSINAAEQSGVFDEICVSTDSPNYAKIATEWGAEVPFLRDTRLAGDKTSTLDVVRSALMNYRMKDVEFDTVAILQPTSPLRSPRDIINGYNQMKLRDADVIISVCETEHSPLWSNILPVGGSLSDFLGKDILNCPRQDLPTYHRINGALYIAKTDFILNSNSLYEGRCYSVIMPKINSIDIDDELDFTIAEILMGRR